MKILKQTMLTILFTVSLYLTLYLARILIEGAIDYAILPSFNWFNKLNFIWKIVIFLFCGSLLFWLFDICKAIALALSFGIAKIFKINRTMVFISYLFFVLAILSELINIWSIYNKGWQFWPVLEFIALSVFVIQMYGMFITVPSEDRTVDKIEKE